MASFEDFLRAQTPTVFARPEPPPPPLPAGMGMMPESPLAAGLNPGGVYIPPQMEGMLPPVAEAPPVPPMPMVGEVMPETKPIEPVDMGYTMPEQFDNSAGIYDDYIGARNRGASIFAPPQVDPMGPPNPMGMMGPGFMPQMQGPATTRAIEAGLGAMQREREFATRFPRATEALNRYGGLPSQNNPARGAGPTAPALTRPRGY